VRRIAAPRALLARTAFARLAVMYGLRKAVQDPPPEPGPSRKTTHWGKRKLKRELRALAIE
jgi:hypothetical protein